MRDASHPLLAAVGISCGAELSPRRSRHLGDIELWLDILACSDDIRDGLFIYFFHSSCLVLDCIAECNSLIGLH